MGLFHEEKRKRVVFTVFGVDSALRGPGSGPLAFYNVGENSF